MRSITARRRIFFTLGWPEYSREPASWRPGRRQASFSSLSSACPSRPIRSIDEKNDLVYNTLMKKLILTRGPQGVGKSTFIHRIGLGLHTLSADALRLSLACPELGSDGGWGISQAQNDKVWPMIMELANQRMSRGETLAVDAMFRLQSDVKPFAELAREHGYQLLIADFGGFPLDQARAQNAGRPIHARVSEPVLAKTFANFASTPFEPDALCRVEKWRLDDGTEGLAQRAMAWLKEPLSDFSSYEKVVHIGDLQGCLSVMIQPGGPLEFGFRDDTRYVFAGDLLDRGIENGALLRWLIDNIKGRDNVDLVWGNHEDHLHRFAQGKEAFAREFRDRTLPQLIEAGVTPQEAAALLARARGVLPYVWRGQKVVVTHAGLPGLPPCVEGEPQWHLLSMQQVSRGTGNYSDPVDQQWERNTSNETGRQWIQVHGHRNHGAESIQATPRSFNLEGEVEFGGSLRLAALDASGWSASSYRNTVYASWRSRFERAAKPNPGAAVSAEKEKDPLDISLPIPEWIRTPSADGTRLPEAALAVMREHSGVMEKPMPSAPHISSLNFTREVFFDKAWDDVVVKARGLFFNTENGEIVARGYEKFFNIEEPGRPEVTLEALEAGMQFPITGYVKENGYLGNIGYDAKTDELFIASKSTSSGDFAQWLREIFNSTVNAETQDRLRRYLRDAEASMVFEVIDPQRDPHMIDYDKPKLVLLDVFHRSSEPEKLGYEDLKKVGARFGLEVKRRAFEFKTFAAFQGWLKQASKDLAYRHSGGEDIEGIVFEDQKGFQTKAKLPHYSFWKRMRSTKDRLARLTLRKAELEASGGSGRNPQAMEKIERDMARCLNGDEHPLAQGFMAWCASKPVEELSKSVLELRRAYDAEVGIDPAHLKTHWRQFTQGGDEAPKAKPTKGPKV